MMMMGIMKLGERIGIMTLMIIDDSDDSHTLVLLVGLAGNTMVDGRWMTDEQRS